MNGKDKKDESVPVKNSKLAVIKNNLGMKKENNRISTGLSEGETRLYKGTSMTLSRVLTFELLWK